LEADEVWVVGGCLLPELVAVGAGRLCRVHRNEVGAEFDSGVRVGSEVVEPRGVAGRAAVRGDDDDAVARMAGVRQRGDPSGAGASADVVQQQYRRTGQWAAESAAVRAELGDRIVRHDVNP
jgi:hypothetical protein